MATEEQIRRALATAPEESADHPEAADLLALYRGDLDAGSAEEIREHLERCRACTSLYLEADAFVEAEKSLEADDRSRSVWRFEVVWRQAALLLLGVGLGFSAATSVRDRGVADRPPAELAAVDAIPEIRIHTVRLYGSERASFSFEERPDGWFQLLLDPAQAPQPGTTALVRSQREGEAVARRPVYFNEGIGAYETLLRGRDLPPGRYSISLVTREGVETDEPLSFQVQAAER